jgi:hypothetical protein
MYPPPPAEILESGTCRGNVGDVSGTCTEKTGVGIGRGKGIGKGKKTPIVPFSEFWSIWPKKVKRSDAEKVWNRLNPDRELADIILSAVGKQRLSRQWQEGGGKFIPHPTTWLNQRRWEDELESAKPQSTGRFAAYDMPKETKC